MIMLPDGIMTGKSIRLKEMMEMEIIAEFVNHGISSELNNANMVGNAEVPECVKEEDGAMVMMGVLEHLSHTKHQDWHLIAEINNETKNKEKHCQDSIVFGEYTLIFKSYVY